MAKVAQQTSQPVQTGPSQRWMATYTRLTAESYLKNLGIQLHPQVLLRQFHIKQSFYHELLRLNAADAYNNHLMQQCRDVQAYVQQKFINWVFSDKYTVQPEEPGYELRERLEEQRKQLVASSNALDETDNALENDRKASTAFCKEQIKAWRSLVDESTERLVNILKSIDIHVDEKQKKRLAARIDAGLDDKPLSEDIMKQLRLKAQPSPLMALLIRFIKEIENGQS